MKNYFNYASSRRNYFSRSKNACLIIGIISGLLCTNNSYSQVIPNNSTNSSIDTQQINKNTVNRISGGVQSGANLFHEFDKFDLKSGNIAIFSNPASIENIIANIQSGKASYINSLIRVDGPANLFLLNKSGFIFGGGSILQVQGSFVASTANSLSFSDGFSYLTQRANQQIKTMGKPVSLSVSRDSGSINIKGNGHQFFFSELKGEALTPSILNGAGESLDGIKIESENSIAFVGNGIYLDSGIISAPSKNIFISSLLSGEINLESTNNNIITYENTSSNDYNDIVLNNKSLIDISGSNNGKIGLYGKNINLLNASYLLSETTNNSIPSEILVNATKNLLIQGTTNSALFTPSKATENVQSSIFSQNLFGSGTNITINAENIILNNGGTIRASSVFTGSPGLINVNASNSVSVIGLSTLEPIFSTSRIITTSYKESVGGDIKINTNNLKLKDTGDISSINIGSMPGGDISINASDTTEITGFNAVTFGPSLMSSLAFRDGDAGNIYVNTGQLQISNGSAIATSTLSSGASGEIFINSKNISINGDVDASVSDIQFLSPTGISASGNITQPLFQRLFRLPSAPTGDAGNVFINTNNLKIFNSGQIAVENEGSGNAGNLEITSDGIFLSNDGTIAASTFLGDSGNISINTSQLVLDSGNISASAKGEGLGGNININSQVFVAFGESIVSANAQNARGGNITFTTKGFFLSRDTQITATSDLGLQFSGTVTLNTPDTDLDTATTTLQTDLSKPEISSICQPTSADSYSEFVATGEGGLPTGAADPLSSTTGWHDPSGGVEQPSALLVENIPEIDPIDDAQGWVKNPDGTMSLVATANVPITQAENSNNCNAQNPVSPSSDRLTTHSHTTSNSPSTLSTRSESSETKASNLAPSR